jgi:DNA-binding response OmpR family regulator
LTGQPPATPRILIVDDDPQLVDRLTQLLEDDYQVQATHDWAEVNRIVFREGCELVLMDINLPTLRGDQLVTVLRRLSPDVKIVYFSSADADEMRRLVAETAADGYMPKSLRGAEILSAIEEFLER